MERISGPIKGYFIAAYAVESGDMYVGFAKVCVTRPQNVWDTDAVHKVGSFNLYRTKLEALERAESQARSEIGNLAPNWHPFNLDSMSDSTK